MNRMFRVVAIVIASLSILVPIFPVAAFGLVNAPRIHVTESTSTNWSGYAVQTNLSTPAQNVVTDVKGSWTVPFVTGPRHGSYYSSDWVGIDGYSSASVEQIGTDSDWINGKANYYAWYEMYPQPSYLIKAITVQPGDVINADVSYGGTSFTLTITDTTNGQSFTTTLANTTAQRSSAEWVVEAPSSFSGKVLPLADFGTVTFIGASTTINGHSGVINDAAWQNDPMTMVTSSGVTKAAPSSLTTAGDGFTVTWYHQ